MKMQEAWGATQNISKQMRLTLQELRRNPPKPYAVPMRKSMSKRDSKAGFRTLVVVNHNG
jgi:hypothetical protein